MTHNAFRAGLGFGVFLAAFHACWAAIVALGWAQPLLDFIFWAHFITPPYHVEAFALERAAALIAFTFAMGLAMGAAAIWLWNRFCASR
jgi:hypothetical protein